MALTLLLRLGMSSCLSLTCFGQSKVNILTVIRIFGEIFPDQFLDLFRDSQLGGFNALRRVEGIIKVDIEVGQLAKEAYLSEF